MAVITLRHETVLGVCQHVLHVAPNVVEHFQACAGSSCWLCGEVMEQLSHACPFAPERREEVRG